MNYFNILWQRISRRQAPVIESFFFCHWGHGLRDSSPKIENDVIIYSPFTSYVPNLFEFIFFLMNTIEDIVKKARNSNQLTYIAFVFPTIEGNGYRFPALFKISSCKARTKLVKVWNHSRGE